MVLARVDGHLLVRTFSFFQVLLDIFSLLIIVHLLIIRTAVTTELATLSVDLWRLLLLLRVLRLILLVILCFRL